MEEAIFYKEFTDRALISLCCSMVLTRYGAPGFATGALGVLGPTRMAYGRTISTVRYVAGLLSDLVIETFAG